MKLEQEQILPVQRTKAQARQNYDRISRFYDCFAGPFEKRYTDLALDALDIKKDAAVLEIGCGTGRCLQQIAESVGKTGRIHGVDISAGMLEISRKRLAKEGLLDRAALVCEDALHMPYEASRFDAVFMSFTLELFDTPEIPSVLSACKRVLKSNGRIGVVGMSREEGESMLLRLYEWAHTRMPQLVDCRPIYVEQSLRDAGFQIKHRQKIRLAGLPGEIVVGVKVAG